VIRDVGTLCALITACVLLWAAAVKLRSPNSTAAALSALEIPGLSSGSGRAANRVARLLPTAEIAVAGLLVAAPRLGALAAVVMFGVFTVVVGRVLVTKPGESIRCGCFGASSGPITAATVVRNVVLIVCAAVPAVVEETVRSFPSFAAMVTVTSAVVVSAVAVQLIALRNEIGSIWSIRTPNLGGRQ
jgi:hypothetical protein